MFDRLKVILGFASAYRRALKSGLSKDDAREAATREMVERRFGIEASSSHEPHAFPSEAASLWRDPEADDKVWIGTGGFEITEPHLALLRKMRFSWDGAERGAPMLDRERPYGEADLLAQIADAFPGEEPSALARRHVEMTFVLARVLVHGVLTPGAYALRNIAPDDVRKAMHGYGGEAGLSDADLGLNADGTVTISDEHLKLLKHLQVRWPSEWDSEERLEEGTYPAASIDPKRPYGDFTFIEVDMARILGRLPPAPPDGVFEPEPELAQHLQRLHWQILGAIQVFVENAEIPAGLYDMDIEL